MDTIILDDGIEYAIIKEIKIKDITYTLFSDINNPEDICYRKTSKGEDGELYYIGLDTKKEFELVNSTFAKNILEEIKKTN
ncbi:MAG: DUF1292 domain-containing protein [Bacilli bacterium]